MTNLYVVATPIGNLGDITFRSVEVLRKSDIILCEDTRNTKKLLNKFDITQPKLISYHQQSKPDKVERIIEKIRDEETVSLVTDAGTPGISDPGNELVAKIRKDYTDQIQITPLPGASALTTLASVAGVNLSKFCFRGFAPNKKGRQKFFKEIANAQYPVFYFDSPYRFFKNLQLLNEINQELPTQKNILVGRELTKMYEQIKQGSTSELLEYFENNSSSIKGEFILLVY